MQENHLIDIARWSERPGPRGIPSICSAHPLVIEAAMLRAHREKAPVLIEATCNQVNQDGGYTGMTPEDFTRFVGAIADRIEFPGRRSCSAATISAPIPGSISPPMRRWPRQRR